jgi:hypothetical protein
MPHGRPISAAGARYSIAHDLQGGGCVKEWIPQIVIGIIVTVVGTLIAESLMRGSGHRHFGAGSHFSGSPRAGR